LVIEEDHSEPAVKRKKRNGREKGKREEKVKEKWWKRKKRYGKRRN
jgi:hypothetical protein